MKIAIKILYKEKEYCSDFVDATDEDIEATEQLFIDVAKGKINYISIERDNCTLYFNKEILKESILILIKG